MIAGLCSASLPEQKAIRQQREPQQQQQQQSGLHVNTPRAGALFSTRSAGVPPSSHAIMSLNTWDSLWQYQFRIILLGDSTVGKSSLLKRFTDGIYSDVADPTVGVDFYARALDIESGVKIKLQLWDTAGQERFR